jgi:hypothetical protein
MKRSLLLVLQLLSLAVFGQSERQDRPLHVSGYLEAYYLYDFGKPDDHTRPSFVYAYNRANEVNINLGLIRLSYVEERFRANLALAAGTYMNANYAAEPGVLQNLYEANVGVKLSKEANLWVDAGVFASHIGFESAIGKDCWNLTRGMLADNSPYYEAGVKFGYTSPSEKWYIAFLVLNGWQRIQRVDGNHTPAFGHQLTYWPNERVTLNSSSFVGNDKPDSVRQMRYFHDLYGIFQLTPKLGLTAGFDIGWEQVSKGSAMYNTWYTPILMLRYVFTEKTAAALRVEYYSDDNHVIVATGSPNRFRTWGYSANIDWQVNKFVLWRTEFRGFNGQQGTFVKNGQPSSSNFALTTALAVSF